MASPIRTPKHEPERYADRRTSVIATPMSTLKRGCIDREHLCLQVHLQSEASSIPKRQALITELEHDLGKVHRSDDAPSQHVHPPDRPG